MIKNLIRPLVSTKTVSTFYTDGKLTPEEFVAAGDILCRHCPTWKWESGDPKKKLAFLPPEKQFLVARGIPCRTRAKSAYGEGDGLKVGAGSSGEAAEDEDNGFNIVTKEEGSSGTSSSSVPSSATPEDDDDEIEDDDDMPSVAESSDPSSAAPNAAPSRPKCRVYEASLTYDKLYTSPRFWLRGVDEDGTTPLTQEQIFEDISEEHAKKTVTMEKHHHLDVLYASIHPCKHAHTMKMMMEMAKEAKKEQNKLKAEASGSAPSEDDSEEPIPVDQYFIYFLKFISTICPTMDIDFTVSAKL
eukprot:MONOS_16819.1-p1 / transcript=MONOS_16819.1 / gene=MONOS_16819 / organism=Monocercomonoides_exilis_PA203 / gene_product=unspecified product / transcript_product=unspecified product / location=Mono_scaffold01171:752-2188(-) / protein_length=301 / sequence_SO=supercontig / SO=protein_coding / is_pseudo=false